MSAAGRAEERIEAASLPPEVQAALRDAFGGARVDGVERLSGGMSQALLLAFTVGGAPYVLRRGGPDRQAAALACMRIAGELGVGPRVLHTDEATGIAVMERVPGEPFASNPALLPGRVERVARTLRRLHDGPTFPRAPALVETVAHFAMLLRRDGDEEVPSEIAETLDRVAPLTAAFTATAPCHRDLNPNNILETPERAVFVDWETAGQGDPFLDLAQLGVFAFARPDDRTALLELYLGRAPTDLETARSLVSRIRALAVYALAFRHQQALAREIIPPDAPVLTLPELFARVAVEREKTSPGTLSRSLQRAMRELLATEAFARAAATLS